MTILICGSMAYDQIMVFQDRFKNHILPDQVHILNICFLAPDMRREFGGCAGNIAYNLNLLEQQLALPMATVGKDFDSYAYWLDKKKINRQQITVLADAFTSQAFITTDLDDNQITVFHPGAMDESHRNKISAVPDVKLGIIAPDGRCGMVQHAEQFFAANIPFIFDPGQGLPMFSGDELLAFIDKATWVAVNDYEWQLMQERTQLSEQQISERVEALIVTRGNQGSVIYTKTKKYEIPAAKADQVSDPTGCGDAYRAGLLYGLYYAMDWQTIGQIASTMGAIKVAQHGTQNHSFTLEQFKQRYEQEFGGTF